MPLDPAARPAIRRALLVPLLLALTACGPDTGERTGRAAAAPPLDALPGCDRVATVLDGFLDGWALGRDSGPWSNDRGGGYGVSCVWVSPRLQSDNPFEVVQGASLGIMTTIDPHMQSEADARSIGWVVEDPAVEAIGGYLLYPAGRLDFAEPLGPIGPQVVVGQVSVAVALTGVMLVNAADEGQPITHRRAVDAAIAVHEGLLR